MEIRIKQRVSKRKLIIYTILQETQGPYLLHHKKKVCSQPNFAPGDYIFVEALRLTTTAAVWKALENYCKLRPRRFWPHKITTSSFAMIVKIDQNSGRGCYGSSTKIVRTHFPLTITPLEPLERSWPHTVSTKDPLPRSVTRTSTRMPMKTKIRLLKMLHRKKNRQKEKCYQFW